jgi:hypothetical protein
LGGDNHDDWHIQNQIDFWKYLNSLFIYRKQS